MREVAASEQISQNELIEQAIAHEVLLRGATLVDDLERAAQRIGELTDAEYAKIVDRSLTAVSYTHLDVYKRQGWGFPACCSSC